MRLNQLLQNVPVRQIQGDSSVEVGPIRFDSRQVQPGDVFVAVRGAQADGHQFIDTAIEKGAAAIVCETSDGVTQSHPVTILTQSHPVAILTQSHPVTILVQDSAEALGIMADNFYRNPSREFQLVGVTGTNGKTTTVTLLWQLFTRLGFKAGLIGTVENRVGEEVLHSTHTTPDAVQLHGLFRRMADAGCSHVFMEVSSHAVQQRRIAGATFAGGVFTNLTHDHLDYHGTFAAYRDAKKRFFDDLPKTAFALVNADDKNGAVMLQNTRAEKKTYSLRKPADFKAKILENSLGGLHLEIDGTEMHARMIGEFNAYNLLAAYAVAALAGQFTKPSRFSKLEILSALSDLRGAEGRFDYVSHPAKAGCIGIVDYAHTPDALEKVLETIGKLKKKGSRVITVAGAGGDRDKTKRPVMAQVSARLTAVLAPSSQERVENQRAVATRHGPLLTCKPAVWMDTTLTRGC